MALLAFATAAIVSMSSARATAPAAMFRGGPAHLGVYASSAPTLRVVRWRFRPGTKIVASPVVANGVVYVGSLGGTLDALRASGGTLLWRFPTKAAIASTAAVWDGVVVVPSIDGSVYGIDAANGRRRWRFATQGERRFTAPGIHGIPPSTELMPDPFDVFTSSPAIAGGVVYFGSGDHDVYALDARTGALRWKFATGDVVHASPAVANGTVYIGSWDRNFYALDAATGALRWKYRTGDDHVTHNQIGIGSSAAVGGGLVYFGARDSHVYALDARTGAVRWVHDDHGSWVMASPALAGGVLYFAASDEKKFFALDARTGREHFAVPYSAFSFSSPAVVGSRAYFGAFDGVLYGVDLRSGAIAAQFLTDGARKHRAAHLDAHGQLDFATLGSDHTYEGTVEAMYELMSLGSIIGEPVIANGTLYVGSTDGTLYALG